MDFKLSGWNYVASGKYDVDKAIEEWKQLAINLPMSFAYDPEKDDKKDVLELLDKCASNHMQVLLEDKRILFGRCYKLGEAEYRKRVQAVVEDFGSHPAVFGFHLGDEPFGKVFWDAATLSVQICNEYAPHLNHFVNLLPYWLNDDEENNDTFYEAVGARTPEEYSEVVKRFVKESGIKYVGYDCYTALCYFEKERYKDVFFTNYKLFGDALRGTDAKLLISLLCTGHMSLRVPTQDDFRFQISSAVACGASGIVWFHLYEAFYDESFRGHPINVWGEKSPTFYALSAESRTFMQFLAPRFEDFEFVWAKCVNKNYGGYETFTPCDDFFVNVETVVNHNPLIVSQFVNGKGKRMYTVMNNDMETPTYVKATFNRDGQIRTWSFWLSPGQFTTLG